MKKFLGKWFCGIFTAAAILFAGCSVESDKYEKVPVSSVTIKAENENISVGGVTKLTATVEPSNAYYDSVEWFTTNDEVLSVVGAGTSAIAVGEYKDDSVSSRSAEVYVKVGTV
ncbi:MAG: Ig-like domain-containing protein [Treponema sp.]|nr:Ig-like domain-containing protein [Treponema sp.]